MHLVVAFVLAVKLIALLVIVFFFSSRRRHTRFDCDWSRRVLFRSHGALTSCRPHSWTRLPSSMTALSGKRKKWEALPDRRLMPTKTWLLQWDRPCPFSATSVGWLRNQLACSDAVTMPGM